MASLAQQPSRTCEDSGFECALKSLQDLGLITQEQYDCLMKLPWFCVPGIGTNPSNILRLLNGETFGCNDTSKSVIQRLGINIGTPMDSDSADRVPGKVWVRYDLSRVKRSVGMTIPEVILKTLNDNILQSEASRSARRLVLNLEGGTIGHYSVFYGGANPYLIDPFDKNRGSRIFSRTRIPFKNLAISPNHQVLFLVTTTELINSESITSLDDFMLKFYGIGIDILDEEACQQLEKQIMENLTEKEQACIKNGARGYLPERGKIQYVGDYEHHVQYVGGPAPDEEEPERPTKRVKDGGKTNTKKKYRAKTLVSTNKYAKRPRIRRSRRKSKSNRINNGKH